MLPLLTECFYLLIGRDHDKVFCILHEELRGRENLTIGAEKKDAHGVAPYKMHPDLVAQCSYLSSQWFLFLELNTVADTQSKAKAMSRAHEYCTKSTLVFPLVPGPDCGSLANTRLLLRRFGPRLATMFCELSQYPLSLYEAH